MNDRQHDCYRLHGRKRCILCVLWEPTLVLNLERADLKLTKVLGFGDGYVHEEALISNVRMRWSLEHERTCPLCPVVFDAGHIERVVEPVTNGLNRM